MVVRRCCANECYNSQMFRKDVAYFALPKIEYFAHLWAAAAGRVDLTTKSIQCISKYYICSEHFEPHCFVDPPHNKRLHITRCPLFIPIPTIFRNNIYKFYPRGSSALGPCSPTPNSEIPIDHGDVVDNGDITVLVIPESLAPAKQESRNPSPIVEIIGNEETDRADTFRDYDNEMPDLVGTEIVEIVEMGKPNEPICRLCASPFDSDELIHIFADSMVAKTVSFVLAGQVTENDSLSQFVCGRCLDKANKCVRIISGFREAQQVQIDMYCNIKQESL